MIGSTVSHYQILERLGGGGMGVVYKARDLRLDRLVALKFLAAQRGAPDEQKRRFLREAKAASSLDHPNICTIFEIGETEDGALFIAMALYAGETLRERVERGPLAVAEAVGIAAQVAAGLARAHERGIVHRDVKPANVMLTADGQVKLLDFGVAKLADQSRLTRAGTAMGTTAYISPEQFHGEPAGPAADIWSLGVLLYQLVTGRLPFEAATAKGMARAIVEQEPRPIAALRSGVPAALQRIVTQALAKRPAERYATMEALRSDLASVAVETGSREADQDRTLPEIPAAGPSRSGPRESALLAPTAGPFEILEPLGSGGMGIVCKARDTRLDRIVALKFLPWELTRDPVAKQRFMQEAHAASALEHPNVCTILEVGETSDGRLYIAMPCYEGETLRRKLEGGPLPVEEAMEVAEQIARGLAKAHHNGIVHRDIKPANLVVTEDGVVKILDFGLAKLAGEVAISHTGSSVGTPAYMSPEQARGEAVDFHTDLWSLGVVLYEMLAGQRPFRAEHEQAVIYAILNQRPQPLREVRPEVPPEVERIVSRLLARDPAERYASADEVFAELRALRGATLTGMMLTRRPRMGVRPWVWVAAGGLALLLLLAGVYLVPRLSGREAAAPLQAKFAWLTDQAGRELFPSLSPDGEYFVYARATASGNLDIYLQRVGGSNPINLTADSPLDDTQPAYSPDGKLIAFRSEREGGGVFLMGATGESVRRVSDLGYNPAWSPDGKELAVATEGVSDPRVRQTDSQLWRIDLGTGARRLVAQADAVQPSWSPHGQRIAYWGLPTGSARRVLWTMPAAGGEAVPVVDDEHLNWDPVWSPDGRYLYFASNRGGSMNLWRVSIDEASGRLRGAPEPITAPSEWSGMLSLSRDGRRLVYASNESRANLERVGFDSASLTAVGSLQPVTQGSRGIRSCDVSPDGQWIAFHASVPQEDLFVVRTDGSGLRQLTNDPFRDRYPRWSAAGGSLIFQSDRSGRYEVWSIGADGGGLRQLTRTSSNTLTYPVWSPDGKQAAAYVAGQGAVLIDLSRALPQRRLEPLGGALPAGYFSPSSWSPDGRWLAGNVGGEGHPGWNVTVYSLAAKTFTRLADHGLSPRWSPDGRRLLYRDEGGIFALDVRSRRSRKVLATPPSSSFIAHGVAPDGRTLYVVRTTEEGDLCSLTLQ